jgi:hypothetical protein
MGVDPLTLGVLAGAAVASVSHQPEQHNKANTSTQNTALAQQAQQRPADQQPGWWDVPTRRQSFLADTTQCFGWWWRWG